MPIYEYKCKNPDCENVLAIFRKMDERKDPVSCPTCQTEMGLVVSLTNGKVMGGTPKHYT